MTDINLTAIRQSMAYHFVRVLLRQLGTPFAPAQRSDRWQKVAHLANLFNRRHGCLIDDETLAVALNDGGVRVELDERGELIADMHERIALQLCPDLWESANCSTRFAWIGREHAAPAGVH